MECLLDSSGERRLHRYLARIGAVRKTVLQRESFATWAMGLMSDDVSSI